MSIGAIAASAIAAILVADGKIFPLFTAFVAALPALATALQQTVDFRGRATWYFIKSAQLQELSLNLKYGGIVEAREAARLLGEIERRMEEGWRNDGWTLSNPSCPNPHIELLNPTKGQPREISSRHQGLEELRIDDASIPAGRSFSP